MKLKELINKIVLTIFFCIGLLYAGTDGTIRGKITDINGEPLPGAQIFIPALEIGAIADIEGNYIIINIPVGVYDVQVRMMGYEKQNRSDVEILMDKTVWLNFKLPIAPIESAVVEVIRERPLVDKGETSKTINIGREEIESLPIRNLTELYSLQSGVVRVESMTTGIPDHEERGLEEIHVRGGRAGEIAYMIDGLYIRNPIFGGIGNGTRLNLFAVNEFDWQPGGFNAEYGDAMSAVSNMHTATGTNELKYKFKYETSLVGASLGNVYDELRGYNDYTFGLGGPVPFLEKLTYWVSGQMTNHENYRVYKFDDIAYKEREDDPFNNINKANLVQPWDNVAGFRGFGFDKTFDIFTKLAYKHSNRLRINFSYWDVNAHRKGFKTQFLYWDEGQNELFRDTKRYTLEVNHSLTSKLFYTFRYSYFVQEQFQGVRWQDSDGDGYPDWYEWRYEAGPGKNISDPYNPLVIPYQVSQNGDTLFYNKRDDKSGWYFGSTPGIYNWETAEEFEDRNGNGLRDEGEPYLDRNGTYDSGEPFVDQNANGLWDAGESFEDISGEGDGSWDGPEFVEEAYYRNGSYWLLPQMYEYNEDLFFDYHHVDLQYEQDPSWGRLYGTNYGPRYFGRPTDPEYYMPGISEWDEGRAFGGHDRFYGTSTAITNEFRFDITKQITDEWRLRSGLDYKSHKLNFFEVTSPWSEDAIIQSFAEYWKDTGPDGLSRTDDEYPGPDFGENNGKWDSGEEFDDANDNGKWDDFREPEEIGAYFQNTYEVPWMVINAGIRIDAVNYNTRIWSDSIGAFSPEKPWYYEDLNGNEKWDSGESVSDLGGYAANVQRIFFYPSQWFYKISPRLGISHVITDQATFVFSYGLYYQTPIYQNVYLNTNRLQNPEELFESSNGALGNATMNASRNQSYEFGFNVQFTRHWAFSLMGWVKNMDQMVTYKYEKSGVYEYQVADNQDYGSAKGIDFTLENRGQLINTMIQYTYSVAKGNSEYDTKSLSLEYNDAPSQEYLMPYDRPHDFAASIYTLLPFKITAGMNVFYQSGYPYTPMIWNGDKPEEDTKNKNTKRSPAFKQANMMFSKGFLINNFKVSMGLNVFNVFNTINEIDVYPLTGTADTPGEYYTDEVGITSTDHTRSASYYDNPWMYSNPREFNFFVRVDFK
ncbi:MAG: carboxypeptidase-like regulatory domain-containing protein [Candidatus Marinimicrobia bacterium]|nr:carboxypeptidase-like regulatory domain-containing protein [Candidatus Neomarinimicrobiota bacterium]